MLIIKRVICCSNTSSRPESRKQWLNKRLQLHSYLKQPIICEKERFVEIKAMKGRGNGTKQRKTRKHHEQKKDQKSRYKLDWNQQRSFGGPKYATHFGPAKLLCLPHRFGRIVDNEY